MHVLGTAGHVDHGKSTLVERLTGIDPDRFAEEKRRGLTIDLGFAWLPLPSGREVGLVDVPGHERFIKNMLAGAGGVSVCLFVVAANEGWKPQSAEHLSIVDVLGITHGVVALTKADLVDADTLELVRADVAERLAPSSLRGADVIACSALTGDGIEDLIDELDRLVAAAPAAADRGRPRLWVDRVFTIAGSGTVVTGTLMGGALAKGTEVEILPDGRRARVRSIQSHKKNVDAIGPGNRVALNLVGLDREGAERGDAVVGPHAWRVTTRADVTLRLSPAEITGRPHALTEKGAHLLYVGSAETPVRIKLLDREELHAGDTGFAQLYLRDPLPLGPGDRFVLRDAGRVLTFGGGVVIDPLPDRARRGDADRVALLGRMQQGPDTALRALLDDFGELDREEALFRSGAREPGQGAVQHGSTLVSDARAEALAAQAREALVRHHREHPLERGMAREALRAELGLEPDRFNELIGDLEGLVADGATVRLATHSIGLTPEQERERERVLQAIDASGYQPPPAPELQVDARLLRALVESGDLVKVDAFYLTAAGAAEARRLVRDRIAEAGPVTVADIRDLLGTSRKYAVPLCEWLDATGATRRQGDVRVLGPKP
ncbi:MAG TPA: selenocysteine-specific translation elongation factor [Actinomycetota bacterium]|nr:selenocysteine-specific translation elongation factor [Actinomycetota bacterium]